jgi:beta,beta-carotene 9',10'-dioxygenase
MSHVHAPASPTKGFMSLEHEVLAADLQVQGELPAWLAGSLVRSGPARFEVGKQSMTHWFDGLAMLYRFTIADGRVSYGNRFLESRSYRAAHKHDRIVYSEFATDPCRTLFKRVQSLFFPSAMPDNANINTMKLGDRFIALTETAIPVQFDARTLKAARVAPYTAPGHLSTAHPHVDRSSGAMLNYAVRLGPVSHYRFFALDPSNIKPRVLASWPVREPSYMHSFGLTERWLVLAESAFVVNPLRLAFAGKPYIGNYRWKPELGSHFTLIDRRSLRRVAGFQTDAFLTFHHINAYDDGDQVVVDLCTYPDAALIEELHLDRLRAGMPFQSARPMRFRLNLSDRSVICKQLAAGGFELPRINYERCNGRAYRYTWGTDVGPSGVYDQIVKIDTSDGSRLAWAEPGCYPSEPVFVASPGAEGEDDGILLSVVLDANVGQSFLLALDAATLTELARARAPHHIPFTFHGQFDPRETR